MSHPDREGRAAAAAALAAPRHRSRRPFGAAFSSAGCPMPSGTVTGVRSFPFRWKPDAAPSPHQWFAASRAVSTPMVRREPHPGCRSGHRVGGTGGLCRCRVWRNCEQRSDGNISASPGVKDPVGWNPLVVVADRIAQPLSARPSVPRGVWP